MVLFRPLCTRSRRAAENSFSAAEAEPLKFGTQVNFVDLAFVMKASERLVRNSCKGPLI